MTATQTDAIMALADVKKPTSERVRELFIYNEHTGILTRRISAGSRSQVGEVVGWKNNKGYLNVGIDSRKYPLHQVIWAYVYGEWPRVDVDHINCNKSDNRLENLRLATRQENQWNTGVRSSNSSGFKGVSFHKHSGKWQAQICINWKNKHIGKFDSPQLAHEAYCKAAALLRGEFGRAV